MTLYLLQILIAQLYLFVSGHMYICILFQVILQICTHFFFFNTCHCCNNLSLFRITQYHYLPRRLLARAVFDGANHCRPCESIFVTQLGGKWLIHSLFLRLSSSKKKKEKKNKTRTIARWRVILSSASESTRRCHGDEFVTDAGATSSAATLSLLGHRVQGTRWNSIRLPRSCSPTPDTDLR